MFYGNLLIQDGVASQDLERLRRVGEGEKLPGSGVVEREGKRS